MVLLRQRAPPCGATVAVPLVCDAAVALCDDLEFVRGTCVQVACCGLCSARASKLSCVCQRDDCVVRSLRFGCGETAQCAVLELMQAWHVKVVGHGRTWCDGQFVIAAVTVGHRPTDRAD